MPVFSAPVLSAKGHSGPPSRVHTFSREINGLSLQLLPLSFFVICRHRLGGCLQKVNVHVASYGDGKQMDAPLVLINSEIGGCFLASVFFFPFFFFFFFFFLKKLLCKKETGETYGVFTKLFILFLFALVCVGVGGGGWGGGGGGEGEGGGGGGGGGGWRETLCTPASGAKWFLLIRFNFPASRGGVSGRFV